MAKEVVSSSGEARITINGEKTQTRSLDMIPSEALPPMGAFMVNVTAGCNGYRFVGIADGTANVAIPYDKTLVPPGRSEDDIETFFYDNTLQKWLALPRDSICLSGSFVCSHFLVGKNGSESNASESGTIDFINAVIKIPEMPESVSHLPTSIKDLDAADPFSGLYLVRPPAANSSGCAIMHYPIEIPAGRQNMQPHVVLSYNSSAGNGLLGVGWSIDFPHVSVDSRWGVPRYDTKKESDIYVYNGEQLVAEDDDGAFIAMPHRTNTLTERLPDGTRFHPLRNEASDSIVRHGSLPSDYWWTVTDRNGTTHFFGKYGHSGFDGQCTLLDDNGNIARWLLAESSDPFGNSVTYFYSESKHTGFAGSTVLGRQVYLDSIRYTDTGTRAGKYTIVFHRWSNRKDVIVSATGGFKEVTADVLCLIEIKYDQTPIRRYRLYTSNDRNSYYKTVLTDIVRIDTIDDFWGCNHTIELLEKFNFKGTRTHFEYHTAPNSINLFGEEHVYKLPSDNINSNFVTSVFNTSYGKATAIGATSGRSWSLGGSATLGIDNNPCLSTMSVGGNFSYGRSQNEGLLSMIDLNGDGLPDKVFKKNGKVFCRKRLPSSDGNIILSGTPEEIAGLSDFLKESGSTKSWGLQASVVCSYSGSWPHSKSSTTTYFADVNSDGLPDLITEQGLLLNVTRQNGRIEFADYYTLIRESGQKSVLPSAGSSCGGIILDGEVDDSIACMTDLVTDTIFFYRSLNDSIMHVIDSLNNTGEYTCEVRDHSTIVYRKTEQCVPLSPDPDMDAVKVWIAPRDGVVELRSRFMLIEDLSLSRKQSKFADGVRYSIQRNTAPSMSNGKLVSDSVIVIHQQTIASDDYRAHDLNSAIRVGEGDVLMFRLQSLTSRSFDNAEWTQVITYTDASGCYDQYGLDADIYDSSADFCVSGDALFQAHSSSSVAAVKIHAVTGNTGGECMLETRRLSSSGSTLQYDTATLKPNKDTLIVRNFSMNMYDKIVLRLSPKDNQSVNWGAVEVMPEIRYILTEIVSPGVILTDTLKYYPPVAIEFDNYDGTAVDSMEHRLFGPLYRGWGQFAYNNNTPSSATDPIDISELSDYISLTDVADLQNVPQIDDSNTFDEAVSAFDAAGLFCPFTDSTRWVGMNPDSRNMTWTGFGDITHITRATVSNTRMSQPFQAGTDEITEYDHPVPQPVFVDSIPLPVVTIRKQNASEMKNYSMDASPPLTPITTTQSWSNGRNRILTDYIDLNGDGYPDFVGDVNVQYTMPWGGIGKMRPLSQHVKGADITRTSSYGTTFGASYLEPSRNASNNPPRAKMSFNGKGSFGSTIGTGNSNTNFMWIDINGDGLPDKLSDGGSLALNIGYAFLPFEMWENMTLRADYSRNESLNMGTGSINIAQSSISTGTSLNSSENNSTKTLLDINGDGLPDKVETTANGLLVYYNKGGGEWSPQETIQNVQHISRGTSFSESPSLGLTTGFVLLNLKMCAGAQTSPLDRSFNKDNIQFADMNGDGLPDYVYSDSENQICVRYNQSGKTNLLKKVTDFTGTVISLDYMLPQPCFENPHRSWVLSKVETHDPNSPLTGNRTLTRFTYSEPYYDRFERTNYGYGRVTTREYDTDGGDTLYRYTVEEYENRSFVKRERKTRDCLYGHNGSPYIENIYRTTIFDRSGMEVEDDTCARPGLYVGKLVTLTNYYEGNPTPSVTTMTQTDYDRHNNIVRFTDFGDTTRRDEYVRTFISYLTGMPHNLVSLPVLMEARDFDGILLRKRTASYSDKGRVESLTLHNTDNIAVYDFGYDSLGNLSHALMPENDNGERMEYRFSRDTAVFTYPVRVRNVSLGLTSSAVYDLRFGVPTEITDVNGNTMRRRYDCAGRVTSATAPYELDGGLPYTVKMDYFPKNYGKTHIFGSDTLQSYACTFHLDTQHAGNDLRTTVLFDGLGRLLQTKEDTEFAGQEMSLVSGRIRYDCFGRVAERHLPFSEDTTFYNRYSPYCDMLTKTRTWFDVLDRTTKVKLPTADSTVYGYGFGVLNGKTYHKTTVTDPLGYATESLIGTRGQTVRMSAPQGAVTLFDYDPIGQLLSSTDPDGLVSAYDYDLLGNIVSRSLPDCGTETITYDPAGNPISLRSTDGRAIDHKYHFDRLIATRYPRFPENDVSYTYGDSTASHNSAGRLIMVEDASGWRMFSYGKLGEVTEETRTFVLPYDNSPYTFVTGFAYDSFNRLLHIDYPDGERVSYRYGLGGRLRSMSGVKGVSHRQYIKSISYNQHGLRGSINYGNGTRTEYTYDLLLRLSALSTRSASAQTLQDITYTYDRAGNATSATNTSTAVASLGGPYTYRFDYDSLHRLTASTGSFDSGSRTYEVHTSYTRNGRILAKTVDALVDGTGGTPSSVQYDRLYSYGTTQPNTVTEIHDVLAGTTNFLEWTPAGNLALCDDGSSRRTLCWDDENRLAGVADGTGSYEHGSIYMYDSDGERTLKLTGDNVGDNYILSSTTLYASPYLTADMNGYTKHYHAEGERIACRTGGGGLREVSESLATASQRTEKMEGGNSHVHNTAACLNDEAVWQIHILMDHIYDMADSVCAETECHWYHTDRLGSASWMTDASGNPVQHMQYMPWGEPFVDRSTTGFAATYTYSGKERDAETGYSYFGARYYSSDLSVWLSVDPMAAKYPSLSPYTYCANNPMRVVDPNGEDIWIVNKDGNKIKYTPNMSSKGFDNYTVETINALDKLSQTKTMGIQIKQLAFNKSIKIDVTSNEGETYTEYKSNIITPTIMFDAKMGIEDIKTGESLSPALALGHEFGHIISSLVDPQGYNSRLMQKRNDEWVNEEEYYNITNFEHGLADEWGELKRTGHSLNDKNGNIKYRPVEMKNSTSNEKLFE